jgi:hypothetical protein
MFMRAKSKFLLVAVLVLMASMFVASASQAQPGPHRRTSVFIGASFGHPFYSPFWDPFWWGPGPWDPFYYPYYPSWHDSGQRDRTVGIRTDISPKEAQVYVDGYFSGTASDFSGAWKRLRVTPGQHEVVLYLKGYKSIHRTLNVEPGTEPRLREKLQPLAAGEAQEPPPTPPPAAERGPDQPREREAPGVAAPDEPARRAPRPGAGAPPEVEAAGFGSLAIRVQPAGAEVLIDGERWQGPEGARPLVVQVSEGSHRVEVRKAGYAPFTTDVQVRQGETVPLNVSLPEQQ